MTNFEEGHQTAVITKGDDAVGPDFRGFPVRPGDTVAYVSNCGYRELLWGSVLRVTPKGFTILPKDGKYELFRHRKAVALVR